MKKINSQFMCMECVSHKLYYDHKLKKIISRENAMRLPYTTYYTIPVKTLKAAKRFIRKHNEIPNGSVWRLINFQVGYPDVIITKGK